MTRQEFQARGLALSREANALDHGHGYFTSHAERLYKACAMFGLLDRKLGDVLEIGPYYGYTPFLLLPNASSYTVIEGDDPAVRPLENLYRKRQIKVSFVDLFDLFGPTHNAPHALALDSAAFDTVLCWETMEHFNFNPVKFVRELFRVLKPGGCAYLTVPNTASFQNLLGLILGRSERAHIDNYFQFEDYVSNGKKAFYGFHWREYSAPELGHLFARAGFNLRQCDTFVAFQAHGRLSLARRLARLGSAGLAALFRRYGTHVRLVAQKPPETSQKS